jgi:hypothetical protein
MSQFIRQMYRVRISRIPLTDNVNYDTLSNEFIFPSGYKTVPDMTRILMKYFEDPIEPGTSLIDPVKCLEVSCRTPGGYTRYKYIDFYCNSGDEEIRQLREKGYFRVPISDDEAWIVEFMNYLEVDFLENSCNSVTYYFKGDEYDYEFPYDNNERSLFHRDAYEQHIDL